MPVSAKHHKAARAAQLTRAARRTAARMSVSAMIPRSLNYARAGQRQMMAPIQNRRHEIKFVDNAYTFTAIPLDSSPPTGIYLGGPVQGAAPYQRIGQRIANKSLRIRGNVIANASNPVGCIGRILVVYDEQTNGATPAWSDVILAYTAAGATSSHTADGINMNNRERFKVLVDEQFNFPATTVVGDLITAGVVLDTTGGGRQAPWCFDRFVPMKDLVTHFKATAGGVGDVATGGIFMFVATSGTDSAFAFEWTARLRYDDL